MKTNDLKKQIRYFERDGYPVKLIFNSKNNLYEAHSIDILTGKIEKNPLFIGKVLGWFYPPGSDLYFSETSEKKYNILVDKIQKRAKIEIPIFCIIDEQAIKVILEKSKYSGKNIRVVYVFNNAKKKFELGYSYLEKVYGETEDDVIYVSQQEFNEYIENIN